MRIGCSEVDFYKYKKDIAHAHSIVIDNGSIDVEKNINHFKNWIAELHALMSSTQDFNTYLYLLGFVIHGLQDFVVHHGMTRTEHLQLQKAKDSPDEEKNVDKDLCIKVTQAYIRKKLAENSEMNLAKHNAKRPIISNINESWDIYDGYKQDKATAKTLAEVQLNILSQQINSHNWLHSYPSAETILARVLDNVATK